MTQENNGEGRLGAAFKTCAACTGAVVVPHLPCLALMIAASGSAIAAAIVTSLPAVTALSIAAATGGYWSWQRRRGALASAFERRAMPAAFVLAAGLMIGLHLPGGRHDHSGHDHGHGHNPTLPLAGPGDICTAPENRLP